jgi:hypothetical protein
MENKMLATFTNEAAGIAAEVVAYYKGGFSVAIKDLDVNEYYPASKVFPTLEKALRAAEEAVQ